MSPRPLTETDLTWEEEENEEEENEEEEEDSCFARGAAE